MFLPEETERTEMWPMRMVFLIALALGWARAETLTIATYNVENYGAADRMTLDGYRKEYPKPEVQKAALRKVIRAVNADVWVLQEVGGAEYLGELQRDLRREGVEYPHTAVIEAADEARRVAVLSRRAFAEVVRHTELEFRYFGEREKVKRGLIEVRFETPAGTVTLFGVHLKSRYTDRADDPRSAMRREGEATAIRDAVLRLFKCCRGCMRTWLGGAIWMRFGRERCSSWWRGRCCRCPRCPSNGGKRSDWKRVTASTR